jgi:electron transport complex protein RnfC
MESCPVGHATYDKDVVMPGIFSYFTKKPLVPRVVDYDPVIRQVEDPERVVIPLDYPGRVRYLPTVTTGDSVIKGQAIGRSRVGNCVCATINGTVKDITTVWTAQSFHSPAIVIENNGDQSMAAEELFDGPVDTSDFEPAMDRLRSAGVAPPWSLSGREYDDSDKEIPELPPVKAVIITGVRQESTILTSQLLLEQQGGKVAEGLKRLGTLVPDARICLTVPEHLRSWAETIFHGPAEIVFLPEQYTGRIEREVIAQILGYRIPNRESYRYHGIAVLDVEYLLAMVDALDGKSSFIQKCLTISGTDLDTAVTVRFALGSSIKDVLGSQGLKMSDYTRPVVGGPMMGFAQYSEMTPLTYNSGIYLIAENIAPFDAIAPCINCGRCARVCPVNIQVHLVNRMIEFGQLDSARELHPDACYECGLCANVCPAERPIVQLLHFCNHDMVHGERYNWLAGENL